MYLLPADLKCLFYHIISSILCSLLNFLLCSTDFSLAPPRFPVTLMRQSFISEHLKTRILYTPTLTPSITVHFENVRSDSHPLWFPACTGKANLSQPYLLSFQKITYLQHQPSGQESVWPQASSQRRVNQGLVTGVQFIKEEPRQSEIERGTVQRWELELSEGSGWPRWVMSIQG